MASPSTETLVVKDLFTPLDLLLWRRFRQEVPGLVEQTLDANRGLADLGLYLPLGTKVVVTPPVPIARQQPKTIVRLFG